MQPTCYVITHAGSRVIDDCIASLRKYNWKFEKFNAVNGQTITQADWQRIGIELSDKGKMSRRPGAQGCWHSHYKLWNKCLTDNTPIVIMEHDAVVNGLWPETLDISNKLVKLYLTAECKVNPAYGRWSKGAHAYTLTPAQALTLIDHARQYGAQAVDKHLGDLVLPWTFLGQDLVTLNPRRGSSSTSPLKS
ncbi:Glycosyl transferase, family 25 [uncultured Caudovirales phage]|uniref:Glycosyl transferase, family 25 n=1 Tax=uncultured Caudovirales phage TaxID=2100421 RepID=A0A6J5LYF1_9CAUD|nr:Glycosyl transferase, family 25 [uncultured Caudovirales phage]